LPAAIAAQHDVERLGQAEQSGNGATGGSGDNGIHIEDIGIGVGIEFQPDGVATAFLARRIESQRHQIDLGAARADIDAAADAEHMALAGNGRFEDQPVDFQSADGDIEIGEESGAAARQQRRAAQHPDFLRRERTDGQRVGEEIQWPPVDLQFGHRGELALGIADFEVMDGGLAEDRAVNAAGAQGKSDFEFEARQLPDEERPAAFGIEPFHRAEAQHRQQQHADQEERQQPGEQLAAPARFGGDSVGHQKAWPIET
jgi:hypothetical protein